MGFKQELQPIDNLLLKAFTMRVKHFFRHLLGAGCVRYGVASNDAECHILWQCL